MNCNNLRQISGYPLDSVTIQNIQKEYQRDNRSWTLGFSGGKDSSALLKLVYLALSSLKNKSKPVTAVFCDTGVEIPIMRSLVPETFNKFSEESSENLPGRF
jgi:DNA sulfur modification protein DndC